MQAVTLLGIIDRTDDEMTTDMRDEHMGYEIVIQTSAGDILIRGCHDMGPHITAPDQLDSLIKRPY